MTAPITAPPKTIGLLIIWAQRTLEISGSTNASQEAVWLLAHALGLKHHELASRGEQEVSADEWARVESVISRRVRMNHSSIYWVRKSFVVLILR